MNSLILCEGKTDGVFLQYYLEKVYSWKRIKNEMFKFKAVENAWYNTFEKAGNYLYISETKGCSRIGEGLETAIKRNQNAAPGNSRDFFDRILVFTDNDEESSAENVIKDIENRLNDTTASFSEPLQIHKWNKGVLRGIDGEKAFELYLMLVPFDENGAIETYLLKSIADNDSYDKSVVEKGNDFVDTVDIEERYLNQRRKKTKAKFDVYFSIRTAVDQYSERQNILRSVPWEEYESIRNDFKIFADLG